MTYRLMLRELAFDQHGIVRTADAERIGVPAVEVRKLAARGALARVGQGVYRMLEVPVTAYTEYAEAVALAGKGAVLADEAVLAAHGLAQVNPGRIRVATPHRVRARLPVTVEVVRRDVPAAAREYVEGVPMMTVAAALIACQGRVMTERLIDGARDAGARGLLQPGEQVRVLAALAGTPT